MKKRIKNETAPVGRHFLELPGSLKATVENEVTKSEIVGYTGNSVDLTDYGIDAPVVYNTKGIRSKNTIPYLYGHYEVIGHINNIRIDNGELKATGTFSDPGERAKRVAGGLQNGVPYQSSMGLDIDPDSVVFHSEGQVVVNGKTFNAPIYVVNKSELVELSAVLFGRDGETSITPLSKETAMLIRNSKPTNPPAPTPAPEPAPVPAPAPAPVPPVHTSNSVPMEEVVELMATYPTHHALIAKGLKDGQNRETIENSIKLINLQNSYPKLPNSHLPDRTDNAFMARVALSLNVSPEAIEARVGKQITDHALSVGNMGLKEMLMYVANAEGGSFNGHSDVANMCNHLRKHHLSSNWSTIDFPNLLNRVAQWSMEEAWKIDTPWAPGKILETSVDKINSPVGRIRPSGGQMWDKLDKDGKLQHASFGEETKYQVSTDTVGQVIAFKREDIVNDDIGIIQEMLALMVEGALMQPDYQLVNTIYQGKTNGFLVNGKSLFELPLTRDNLELVYNLVKEHDIKKGDKSVKTKFNTRWALVHTTNLERTAWELVKQEYFVTGTETNPQGQKNYFFNRFDLWEFPQLDNATYNENVDPYAWGLMPVSARYAPYTIAYLSNRRRPTTETIDLPGDMLGFGVRGYWEIKVQEREKEAVAWSFPGSGS